MTTFTFDPDATDDPAIPVAGLLAIDTDGQVVLIRDHQFPDWWSIPAGKREPGETGAETALREGYEEALIRVARPVLLGCATGPNLRMLIYVAALDIAETFVPHREATDRTTVPLAELGTHIAPYFRDLVTEFLPRVEEIIAAL